MDLLIYLMAKRKKKIFPHKSDLLAYLLSRSTYKYFYQTFTGITLSVDNTLNAPMKIKLSASEMSQSGTPTPESPQDIHTISGNNKLVISNSDNTISQEAEINLGDIEYCKIGNYEDEIFKNIPAFTEYDNTLVEGAWYIKKNIGKVVLDGSENWALNSSSGDSYRYWLVNANFYNVFTNIYHSSITSDTYYKNNTLCNYFKGEIFNNTAIGTYSMYYANQARWFLLNTNITSLEDFKTWLSTHNTEVYYILATPTYTQITGTLAEQLENIYKKLKSFKGTTNISQVNNDLPFILHCEIAMKNY